MANLKYKWDNKCICNNQRIKRIKYEFVQTTNNIQSSWGKVYKYYCSNCKGLIGWQKIGGKKLKKIGNNRNVRYNKDRSKRRIKMGYIAYPCKYKILKIKIIIMLYNRKGNIVDKAKIDKKRDETILKYKSYVKKIANNILRTLPQNLFEEDELINIGIIGLIYAYDNYDEKFNCSFINYASYRIRGSILSELRKRDFLKRTTRKKIKDYEKLILTLERKLFRKPTYEELANFMNINIEEIYNLHKLKEITFTDYSNVENLILQNFYNSKDNENGIINKQQYDIIINIINKLTTREKEIIYKYYFYDMSMNEIGISYNITESRVSQIIRNTIDKIRNKLKKYENGDLKMPITSSEEIDRINICNQDGCNNKVPFGYRFKHCPSCHSKKMKLAATKKISK